ncbi:hypothetical protein FALBO_4629 [Fusarium albosuccineum]|uniref:Uncharacterized protein n=1 Tax=Fusarium albosuccineum TaxID=1237068 RepID=A0A8H4PG77_9HYPO|nr:hypothetical protein FALBO_4629 [Fusarium albosuccineum]
MPGRHINKTAFLTAFQRQRPKAQDSVGPPLVIQPGHVLPPIQGYLLDSFTARMDQTCGPLRNLSYRCDVLRAEEEIKAYAYFFRGPRGWQTLLASLQRWINAGSLTMIRGDDSTMPHVRFSMDEVEISGDFMLLRRKEQDSIMLGSD